MSKSWASTLRLPRSTFPPRPLPERRPVYLQRSADDLYRWQEAHRPAHRPFVVHDGPPYANGTLHVGHALNKILKDMSLRVQLQQGRRVRYVPGWDCHGLPIELKALAAFPASPSPVAIRKAARDLAARTVLEQMREFRRFGVMADWDGRWRTMDAAYEVRQLRLFQQLVHKGLIYRRYKPVYWSPSSRTALAEAELEYSDRHLSTAAFVQFPIVGGVGRLDCLAGLRPGPLSAVIWTTTPWTLPANEAIAVHRDLDYAVVRIRTDSSDAPEYLLVAEACLETFSSMCCREPDMLSDVVARAIPGSDLLGLQYVNSLRGRSAQPQPIIHASFVTAGSGSGLVHIAPGHGFEDYEVGMSHGLPVPAPVDGEGRFTDAAFPDEPARLTGLSVQGEGGTAVLALLGSAVLATHRYQHKYPYDWRTKKPIIVRATAQWFADVAEIKAAAVASLQTVQFVPEAGRSRLESFVQGRSEWCISRQRAWGVPIPALLGDDGSVVLTEATVEHIVDVVRKRGTDAWWSDPADEPAWIPAELLHSGVTYRRSTDTMDVWFDSGSSWTQANDGAQADVYLEGTDQHRGWFQSSLLTRVAALGDSDLQPDDQSLAPFKTLVTHGFLLDGDGKKMSKSLGNIVLPAEVMDGTLLPPLKPRKGRSKKTEKTETTGAPGAPVYDALGPDALRLWVATSDYTGDVVLSQAVLQAVHTTLTRYRTMIKMLLGSMHESARIAPLTTLDHMAVLQLRDAMADVAAAFARFEFYKGMAGINRWLANDLSAFYLEAAKDRLYCADGGGVLEPIFLGLMRMLAPVVPMLVEEAWDHAPAWLTESTLHPLRELYKAPLIDVARLPGDEAQLRQAIPVVMAAHAAVKAASERARTDKVLGSSLQCSVVLEVPVSSAAELLNELGAELDAMFVVSSVAVNAAVPDHDSVAWRYAAPFEVAGDNCTAWVLPPRQAKCPRCWRYVAEEEDQLCGRCADVVNHQATCM
ncbi:isoleucyl-tRNA synthetase [Grosmannia clavigera kw1407]|uniref:Isoleucine--tRNA ligase, mitochondrial n=1 Tax=Grosmannia clavigera (strain kw1407 / UAMH 11150) TaxID=655863 RepID=F0XU40_GROCL|nr:isoleucyl-tRNA synthetase [Grosmannia clavigera kw1407]EFW98484.1 isoleucyl-tRNA synthetase [Grosmannia clavigera kw1407]